MIKTGPIQLENTRGIFILQSEINLLYAPMLELAKDEIKDEITKKQIDELLKVLTQTSNTTIRLPIIS